MPTRAHRSCLTLPREAELRGAGGLSFSDAKRRSICVSHPRQTLRDPVGRRVQLVCNTPSAGARSWQQAWPIQHVARCPGSTCWVRERMEKVLQITIGAGGGHDLESVRGALFHAIAAENIPLFGIAAPGAQFVFHFIVLLGSDGRGSMCTANATSCESHGASRCPNDKSY